MMDKIYENLNQELEYELTKIDQQTTTPRKRLSASLKAIKKCLQKLKKDTLEKGFENDEEEIFFFKKIKPFFYAKWIYAFEVHLLEMNRPQGTPEMLKAYLEDELQLVHRYFKQNAYYYQYFKAGADELDSYCFKRKTDMEAIAIPEMPETEEEFCTACDPLFAKFIAYEMLQEHILNLLNPKKSNEEIKIKKNPQKTLIDLSVDQLGLITRAADDARLIVGKSFSKICEELAPFISTPQKESISPHSLRANAYVGEDIDKGNVIRLLEKMIHFVKGY